MYTVFCQTGLLGKLNLSIFNSRLTSMLEDYPVESNVISVQIVRQSMGCFASEIYPWGVVTVERTFGSGTNFCVIYKTIVKVAASSSAPPTRLFAWQWYCLDSSSSAVAGKQSVCEPHVCICANLVNSNGHHVLSCNKVIGKYAIEQSIWIILSPAEVSLRNLKLDEVYLNELFIILRHPVHPVP